MSVELVAEEATRVKWKTKKVSDLLSPSIRNRKYRNKMGKSNVVMGAVSSINRFRRIREKGRKCQRIGEKF
jgi:hypothetical protein